MLSFIVEGRSHDRIANDEGRREKGNPNNPEQRQHGNTC